MRWFLQRRYPVAILLLFGARLVVPLPLTFAETPPASIQYVYDELNRLIAVIDRENNAARYVYDAVGNILAIERANVGDISGPIGITFVAPTRGTVGTRVTIYGKGFGTTASQVGVSFNGTSATVDSVSGNRISTSVPSGATTGLITVTALLGTATSPKAFRVLGPIAITPATAQVAFGGTQQLTALAQGGEPVAAFWDVNGIRGGATSVGSISASGLYTAPSTAGAPSTVTITAADKDDVSSFATATLTLLPPITATLASRGVSVRVADATNVDKSVTAILSVVVVPTPTTAAGTPAVSVRVAGDATTSSAAPQVSVGIEQ